MTKQNLANNIINEMVPYLSSEQTEFLKRSFSKHLHGYAIVSECTTMVIKENDNEKYLKRFMIELKVQNLAEGTINQYLRETKLLFDFTKKNFRDITNDDIMYYFALLTSESKVLSQRYLDNKRKHISSFFSWCYENHLIKENPMKKIKKIKYEDGKKEVLTNREIVIIRDSCKNDHRKLALLDLLISTGIRISECVSLNVRDINFNTGEVSVYGKKTRKWRTVYLDDNAQLHIKQYLEHRRVESEALFINERKPYGRISKRSIENIVKKIREENFLNKKCTVHTFRRTLASKLYKKGMPIKDIARILGNSVSTLEKYYIVIDTVNTKYMFEKYMS